MLLNTYLYLNLTCTKIYKSFAVELCFSYWGFGSTLLCVYLFLTVYTIISQWVWLFSRRYQTNSKMLHYYYLCVIHLDNLHKVFIPLVLCAYICFSRRKRLTSLISNLSTPGRVSSCALGFHGGNWWCRYVPANFDLESQQDSRQLFKSRIYLQIRVRLSPIKINPMNTEFSQEMCTVRSPKTICVLEVQDKTFNDRIHHRVEFIILHRQHPVVRIKIKAK